MALDVFNPSTGALLAAVADCEVQDARTAIDGAADAQKNWAERTRKNRAGILHQLFELMVAHAHDLACILTAEMSKPLAEAKNEILYNADYVGWFAEEAKRIYGDTNPEHMPNKRIIVVKLPSASWVQSPLGIYRM